MDIHVPVAPDPVRFRHHLIIGKAFSSALFRPVPKFQQFCKPQIIEFIFVRKGDQKEGDDRGHLIGDQFDGSNGLENIIPQDADINRRDFKNFENALAEKVKDGETVKVKIETIYEGASHRPTDILVTYSINGVEDMRIFPNKKEN